MENDAFLNLELRNILKLIEICISTNRYETLKSRYSTYYAHFEETFDFLVAVDAIKNEDGNIVDHNNIGRFKGATNSVVIEYVIELVSLRNSIYTSETIKYIRYFSKARDGLYKYKPNTSTRIRESGIRNFLIELGVIEYDDSRKTYILDQNFLYTFSLYLDGNRLEKSRLDWLLDIKKSIGLAAEKLVLEYERNRLLGYPELFHDIEHVALTNVSAGYDIRSWEEPIEECTLLPRYIEVKAVPKSSYRFFWSSNEIETAKEFKERYFIYLVPRENNEFYIDDTIMISNPYQELFNESDWVVRPDSYRIWRR